MSCCVEVREVNMYREGDLTHYNQPVTGNTLDRCWSEVLKQSNYEGRRHDVDEFNRYFMINVISTETGFPLSVCFGIKDTRVDIRSCQIKVVTQT